MKRLFENETPEQRSLLIKANAAFTETAKIKRQFTNEELEQMRQMFASNALRLAQEEQAKKAYLETIKQRTKAITNQQSQILNHLRDGSEVLEIEVYAMDNQNTGHMEYFDIEGNMVSQRPLLPSERQTRINSLH